MNLYLYLAYFSIDFGERWYIKSPYSGTEKLSVMKISAVECLWEEAIEILSKLSTFLFHIEWKSEVGDLHITPLNNLSIVKIGWMKVVLYLGT